MIVRLKPTCQGRVLLAIWATAILTPVARGLQAGRPLEHIGYSSTTIGDQDGDGVVDFVVGVPGHSAPKPQCGGLWLISGASGKHLLSFSGTDSGVRLGWSLAGIPRADTNSPGEFVVASFGGVSTSHRQLIEGSVAVLFPGTDAAHVGTVAKYSGLSSKPVWSTSARLAGDGYGQSLSIGPDISGDAIADLVVGVPFGIPAPYAAVLSGKDGATLRELIDPAGESETFESRFGWSVQVCTRPKANSEGATLADVLVGAPRADLGSGRSGAMYCIDLLSGELRWSASGNHVGDEFGWCVQSVNPQGGSALCFAGAIHKYGMILDAEDAALRAMVRPVHYPQVKFDGFSASVCLVGDFDGDGSPDLALGEQDEVFSDGGYGVSIVSSGTGRVIRYIKAGAKQVSTHWAADLNGDGFIDLMVGLPLDGQGIIVDGRRLAAASEESVDMDSVLLYRVQIPVVRPD